jgi:RNA polymerase sigma-70 factor (ECF subfamily)
MSEHERCLAVTPCGGEECTRDRCRVLVRRARTVATPEARAALEAFCEASWPKVLGIVRRQGYRGADAEDLTQAYFARFLERGDLEYAASWQGSLEVFLNVSVRYFLSNERDRARAQKRGGGRHLLSLDETPDPGAAPLEPVDATTPETLLAQAQATRAIEDALSRLRSETERAGGAARLARVERYLLCEVNTGSYRRMADEWGVGSRPCASWCTGCGGGSPGSCATPCARAA